MKRLLPILILLILSFIVAPHTYAGRAALYLLPLTGSYTVGSTFSVVVKVNSGGIPINAAEGSLIFNTEELNVVSLSKSGSIFTLWTVKPTFLNTAGTIEFGGAAPTSFTGTAGTIITITFKAKRSAAADINFLSGAVLAADGKGTNVLANMSNGTYTLRPGVVVPSDANVVPPAIRVSVAPIIFSITHPDSEKWYSNNDPEFFWQLPPDVTAVKLWIDKIPQTIPTVLYIPPISERKLKDLTDGVWYFHAQFRNQYGWGEVTDRKILIDTKPPEPFGVVADNEGDPANPSPILHFNTTDTLSGIEYYEVKIGEAEPISVTPAYLKENLYQMPPQAPGKHTVLIKAVDAAGNFTIATTDIKIEPIEMSVIAEEKITIFPIFGIVAAIDYLTIVAIVAALIVIVVGVIFYIWYRISLRRKRVKD